VNDFDIPRRNPEHYQDLTAFKALAAVSRDERNYPRVYICSPYRGDTARNTANALRYCRFALLRRRFPVAPHVWLPLFMDDANPAQRELALSFGLRLLCGCREVWVFGERVSDGMAREIKTAERRGIPIRRYDTNLNEVQTI
jgi:hypothetical protein